MFVSYSILSTGLFSMGAWIQDCCDPLSPSTHKLHASSPVHLMDKFGAFVIIITCISIKRLLMLHDWDTIVNFEYTFLVLLFLNKSPRGITFLCSPVNHRVASPFFVLQWITAWHHLSLFSSGSLRSITFLCSPVNHRVTSHFFVLQWITEWHHIYLFSSESPHGITFLCSSVNHRVASPFFVPQLITAWHHLSLFFSESPRSITFLCSPVDHRVASHFFVRQQIGVWCL